MVILAVVREGNAAVREVRLALLGRIGIVEI